MSEGTTWGKEFAISLAKAQAAIEGAIKDKTNPHFQSKYADLNAVWEACRKPLTDNGLSVAQIPEVIEGKMVLHTMLLHESGQYLDGYLPIQVAATGATAQQVGSAITYARRYALASMAGVAPQDDDDGNAASQTKGDGAPSGTYASKAKPAPKAAVSKPEPASVPVNPETGNVEPHQIAVPMLKDDSGTDWMAWGSSYAAAIKASANEVELNRWTQLNMPGMAACSKAAEKIAGRVLANIEAKRKEFAELPTPMAG